MCTFEAPSVALVLSHLRLVHSNDPHFVVLCGCSKTSRSFTALYSHIYRHHHDLIQARGSHSGLKEVFTSNDGLKRGFPCGAQDLIAG
jgi:hypothetical protein